MGRLSVCDFVMLLPYRFWWMSFRRHSSATLSSPRIPASTIRIFSSVLNLRRVARFTFRTSLFTSFLSVTTMSQKHHLNNPPLSVQLVLTGYSQELYDFVWSIPMRELVKDYSGGSAASRESAHQKRAGPDRSSADLGGSLKTGHGNLRLCSGNLGS